MSRHSKSDGDLAGLGILITAGHGLDREWDEEAHCRRPDYGRIPDGPTLWQFDPNQTWTVRLRNGVTVTVEGEQAIAAALMICRTCPVQWECTSFAVEARHNAGTWGVYITDLLWLQKRRIPAQDIIDAARMDGVPLQVRVRELREADEAT